MWCSGYHGMPHFSWWEHESLPATCESSDMADLLFLVVLPQPQVISSHTWEDEYSPRLKDTLCSFLSLSPASCSPSSASWILTTLAPSPLIIVTLSQWDYWLFGAPLPTIQPHYCPQEGWWSIYHGFNPAYFLIMRNHSPEAIRASLITQLVKNLPEMWETWVRSLDWEDPLEKGKATHSNIPAWRLPWAL